MIGKDVQRACEHDTDEKSDTNGCMIYDKACDPFLNIQECHRKQEGYNQIGGQEPDAYVYDADQVSDHMPMCPNGSVWKPFLVGVPDESELPPSPIRSTGQIKIRTETIGTDDVPDDGTRQYRQTEPIELNVRHDGGECEQRKEQK